MAFDPIPSLSFVCLFLATSSSLVAERDNATDITRYFFLLPDTENLVLSVYRTDSSKVEPESKCDRFNIPMIEFVCDGAVRTTEMEALVKMGAITRRIEFCVGKESRSIKYVGMLPIEGLITVEGLNELKLDDILLWRKVFRRPKVDIFLSPLLTRQSLAAYEILQFNYAMRTLETMKGFVSWTTDGVEVAYLYNGEGSAYRLVGCQKYAYYYSLRRDMALYQLNITVANYLLDRSTESTVKNPCLESGLSFVVGDRTVQGSGKHEECYALFTEMFEPEGEDSPYDGPHLLALKALSSMFRTLGKTMVSSNTDLRNKARELCAETMKEFTNEFIDCTKVSFLHYLLYHKYGDRKNTFVVRSEISESPPQMKNSYWLSGFVVEEHSLRHARECCPELVSRGVAVLPPQLSWSFLPSLWTCLALALCYRFVSVLGRS